MSPADGPGPAALPDDLADVVDPRLPPVEVTLDPAVAAEVGRALFWMVGEDTTVNVYLTFRPDAVEVRVGRTTTTVSRSG